MKVLLVLLSLLAPPLRAEIRAAVRGGVFAGGANEAVGTAELEVRAGNWSVAPPYEVIRGGYGEHAIHVDVRRLFLSGRKTFWIGAGPTVVKTNAPSSKTTWNADAGMAWRLGDGAWEPFVAARYYSFRTPVFRDVVKANGAVLSVGISRRLH
jgi:hypothetical protein